MPAIDLAKLLRSLGICYVVAVAADLTIDGRTVFGGLATLIGIPLLVRLAAAGPGDLTRWWLGLATAAAPVVLVCHVLPWVTQIDPVGTRQIGQLVATVGAAAYARGMWVWFASSGQHDVGVRYRQASTWLAGVAALWAVAMAALLVAVEPVAGDDADPARYFDREVPLAWVIPALALILALVAGWWNLSRANRAARRQLEALDRALPGAALAPA